MPKSRKKKNAQKDFQKVKLKVGKTLKKADNVTNPSFHTRTIQVTQKIKTAASTEPSTKRKLNITELLNQFQHYSTSTKHDAVTGLRELLSGYPDIIVPNLASLLERTAQLFVDKDPVVRQSVIKLLKVIFTGVTEKHIASFFRMIGAHLCCAMTHIYEDIQADSLQILDLLLDHFPGLVVGNSSQILPNFIEQISRRRIDSKSGTSALSVNPNLKMSSHNWRAKVLSRLHKLLSAILGQGSASDSNDQLQDSMVQQVQWKKGETTCVQPWPQHFIKRWRQSGFILGSKVNSGKTPGVSLSDEAGLRKFVQLIMPLLIECWMESNTVSAFSNKGSDNLITTDSLPLRRSVVNVIQLLCHYVTQEYPSATDWMKKMYFNDLKNHLLKSFPYSVHVPAKKKTKMDNQTVQNAVTILNIAICDIMTHFLVVPSGGSSDGWKLNLVQYLEDVISHECQDKQQIKDIINILSRLIKQDNQINLDSVLEVLLQKYLECHPLSSDKKLLLTFFSDLILDRRQQSKLGADIIEKFMISLPDLFMLVAKGNNQMAAQILEVMKKSACQNCWVLLQQLNKFITKTIDTDELLINMDLQTQKSLLELMFYVPHLPKYSLKTFIRLMKSSAFSIQSCQYLLQTIYYRYAMAQKTPETSAEYISFMLSVLLGHGDDRTLLQHEYEIVGDADQKFLTGSLQWERTLIVAEAVSLHLRQYGDTEQMIQIINNFLQNILSNEKSWAENQLISLMILSNQMEFYNYPITEAITASLVPHFWTFCEKVTEIQTCLSKLSLDRFNLLCDFVLEKLIEAVCNGKNDLKLLIEILNRNLKDQEGEILELNKVCNTGVLWLHHYDTWIQRSRGQHDVIPLIKLTVREIQESNLELKQHQWWSDFSFLVSRLKL